MTSIGYAFAEALTSLWRAGVSALMSIGTIAIAFFTLAGFALVAANLQAAAARWAEAAEMSVYLRDDVDETSVKQMVAELSGHAAVAGVEWVSKTQALERFRRDFPELADVAEASENPFPSSLEVRLRTDPASAGAADALAEQYARRETVADVRYDREWLSRLLAIVSAIRLGGVIVASVLVLGAAFTVMAVVRLSLHARREEIDIMRLVGAPFGFVRGPAIAEGMLLGGIGALVALLALTGVAALARPSIDEALTAWGAAADLRFLAARDIVSLLSSGVLVGAMAGLVASRSLR